MGKKVISYSLWGAEPKYTIGALKNIICVDEFFPDFECWFYVHEPSVPVKIIEALKAAPKTQVILRNADFTKENPMMWRFEAIDTPDVEVMMPRDCDSRITVREKNAIEAWLTSGKKFHIMRDHPLHYSTIMGGMFGTRKLGFSWTEKMTNYSSSGLGYDKDQMFLRNEIYPFIKDDSVIHASFNRTEAHATDFPDARDKEYHFVGEYISETEMRNQFNINQIIHASQ